MKPELRRLLDEAQAAMDEIAEEPMPRDDDAPDGFYTPAFGERVKADRIAAARAAMERWIRGVGKLHGTKAEVVIRRHFERIMASLEAPGPRIH